MTRRAHAGMTLAVAALLAAALPGGTAWGAPAAPAASTAAGPALTLDQAIQQALAHNPQVLAAQQAVSAAQQGVLVAHAGLDPKISLVGASAFGTSSATAITPTGIAQVLPAAQGTGSASFTGTLPLYNGGVTETQVTEAQAQLASAEGTLRETDQNIALNTATAFLNVLSAQQLTAVRQAQLKEAQDTLALTQAQVRAGVAAQSDVIQVQAQVAQAQVNLLTAQAQIGTDVAALQALLGADVTAPVNLQTPAAPPAQVTVAPEAVLQQALAHRPEIAVAKAGVATDQAALTLARLNAGPQVSLGLSAAYTPVSTSAAAAGAASYGLTGTVSLPLYDAGLGKAQVAQAQANLNGAQAQLDAATLSVKQDAYQAYLGAVQAAANVTATQAAAEAADAALRVAEGQYRAGVGTILAVTTAQANAAQAEVNAASAIYSYGIALATLQHAQGLTIQAGTAGGGGTQ